MSAILFFRGSEKEGGMTGGKAELFHPLPTWKKELNVSKEHDKNCQNKGYKSKQNSSSFPAFPKLILHGIEERNKR